MKERFVDGKDQTSSCVGTTPVIIVGGKLASTWHPKGCIFLHAVCMHAEWPSRLCEVCQIRWEPKRLADSKRCSSDPITDANLMMPAANPMEFALPQLTLWCQARSADGERQQGLNLL
jgi:hypothetical protein